MALNIYAFASGVNKANYDKLKIGMTYAQVVEIFGREGEVIGGKSENGVRTDWYRWTAKPEDRQPETAYAEAMFQNDQLVMLGQSKLK
ncbi:MAG TPA: hypothetical protein VGO43_00070 [Pyrinomonadaceae bacterium]|jgi:hypothetical protein|nr:hypothetical protein [Pyrinomonadaceae bacterium]